MHSVSPSHRGIEQRCEQNGACGVTEQESSRSKRVQVLQPMLTRLGRQQFVHANFPQLYIQAILYAPTYVLPQGQQVRYQHHKPMYP